MLIRFTVENFLSFKHEVEFSMVAAGRLRKHKDHVYIDEKRKDFRLLKTGVIYGANASGKSNLIKAMAFAQNLIVEGRRPKEGIATIPFLLDRSTEKQSSKFRFEIKNGRKFYAYRFEVDSTRVLAESLYELRPASEKMLFERALNSEGKYDISFGKFPLAEEKHKNRLQYTAEGTRNNQLFLYESVDRNLSYFSDVYNWFSNKLVLLYTHSVPGPEIGLLYVNNENGFREKYRELIQLYDLDIDDIILQKLDIETEKLFSAETQRNISQSVSTLPDDPNIKAVFYNPLSKMFAFANKFNQIDAYQFMTSHQVKQENRQVNFDLRMESDGTIRLFELTPALIRLLSSEDEIVFIIDEIERSLHAQMTRNILDIFLSNSAGQPSQLIVTTHESALLDLDLLRRDEIWFIEKDRYAASQVYSLDEFATRPDMDIEKGYLRGRFGAIPLLPSYNLLDWRNNDGSQATT